MKTSEQILLTGIQALDERLHQVEIRDLLKRFDKAAADAALPPEEEEEERSILEDPDAALAEEWAFFLMERVQEEVQAIENLHNLNNEFSLVYAQASEEDRRVQVLDFARKLGQSKKGLRGDRKAFKRYFGADAVVDRYSRRVSEAEFRLHFYLGRLGATAHATLAARHEEDQNEIWKKLALVDAVRPLFGHTGDKRVATAAVQCLVTAVKALHPTVRQRRFRAEKRLLDATIRLAQRPRDDVWLQFAAMELLDFLRGETLYEILALRMQHPAEGDDLFVRNRAVRLIGEKLQRMPPYRALVPMMVKDPSPFVRQGVAEMLATAPAELTRDYWPPLAREDEAHEVRCHALLQCQVIAERPELFDVARQVIAGALTEDPNNLVRRVGMKVAVETFPVLRELDPGAADRWYRTVIPAIEEAHRSAPKLDMRRWAAQARERLWLASHPEGLEIEEKVRKVLEDLRPGQGVNLPKRIFAPHDDALVGRVLSVIAIDDYALDLERGRFHDRLTRGYVLKFRAWRFVYEWKRPKPDKRQALMHTTGRVHYGEIRAPSAILAELAQTTVPGEPLFMADEDGWRNYLPLVDDMVSSLNQLTSPPKTIRFYTCEGVTEMTPPPTLRQRIRVWFHLVRHFARYAEMRNWRSDRKEGPEGYVKAFEKLGFAFRFVPYPSAEDALAERPVPAVAARPAPPPDAGTDAGAENAPGELVLAQAAQPPRSADPAVLRFFPQLLPIPLVEPLERLRDYLMSPYENNLKHLITYVLAAAAYFTTKHYYGNATQRKWRNSIPLVVGGWGTRGKSGTERIKAAMFSAVGAGIVSKTTGCEAMFVQANSFAKATEFFLYRPYDKATIWEQRNVVRIASKMGARIFLWECMGLTPSYVEILQRHWMRDNISTLTNTYPDHEDLQGPAGHNVAETMVYFISYKGRVVTTEEYMFPILREGAKAKGTQMRGLGWAQAWLIPPDVIARFPYDEHPYNIALVCAVGEELGIERDFALKEMADRVIPDLGVLRTYPRAPVKGRTLEFVMGMSANERHGAMGNWNRMGFAEHDIEKDDDPWITTVINNRADRVPRSQVFAGILATAISADRHILIGGNLKGLAGYIRNAWDGNVENLTLWRKLEDSDEQGPQANLVALCRQLREPWTIPIIERRLARMLGEKAAGADLTKLREAATDASAVEKMIRDLGVDEHLAPDVARQLAADVKAYGEYEAFDAKLAGKTAENTPEAERQALDDEIRQLLWSWFDKKIVIVANYYATGDQIINRIARETPPHFKTRIMGMQNIKGTGLDYVYRWEAWRVCWEACQAMMDDDENAAEAGVRELGAFRDYGILCERYVLDAVEKMRSEPVAQKESFQAELNRVLDNLKDGMKKIHALLAEDEGEEEEEEGAEEEEESFWSLATVYFGKQLEQLLDGLVHSIYRRLKSDSIYNDLIDERIGRALAVQELQGLVKSQKGGWLKKWWAKVRA